MLTLDNCYPDASLLFICLRRDVVMDYLKFVEFPVPSKLCNKFIRKDADELICPMCRKQLYPLTQHIHSHADFHLIPFIPGSELAIYLGSDEPLLNAIVLIITNLSHLTTKSIIINSLPNFKHCFPYSLIKCLRFRQFLSLY